MKKIPLTQGRFAIVDDDQFAELRQHNWHLHSKGYAARECVVAGRTSYMFMHRVIAGTPKGMETDHINGDKLDNRFKNLRVCTKSENMRNRGKQRDNKSGFKGVYFQKLKGKFASQIRLHGKVTCLGLYSTAADAHAAYCAASARIHGEFGRTV